MELPGQLSIRSLKRCIHQSLSERLPLTDKCFALKYLALRKPCIQVLQYLISITLRQAVSPTWVQPRSERRPWLLSGRCPREALDPKLAASSQFELVLTKQ